MPKRTVSLVTTLVVGIMALALGWLAHAALPLSAQGVVVQGQVAPSPNPGAPDAPAGTAARLTYQGRLTNSSGTPINSPVSATFRLYDSTDTPIYTATRTITPTNGLFTVNLGDGADPNLYGDALSAAAFIGVAVGGDAEMTPRQAFNTVVGHSDTQAGVVGSSPSGTGVWGVSNSGFGVYAQSNSYDGVHGLSTSGNGVFGFSDSGNGVFAYSILGAGVSGNSTSGTGVIGQSTSNVGVRGESTSNVGVLGESTSNDGVRGKTEVITRAGVVASGAGTSGIALEISTGGIKVTGAGIGSPTPVFIHQAHTSGLQNNMCGSNTETVINHPLTNGDANAILLVTPNAGLQCCGVPIANSPVGVFYDSLGACGYGVGRWVIYNYNFTANMNDGQMFNVLVVKP